MILSCSVTTRISARHSWSGPLPPFTGRERGPRSFPRRSHFAALLRSVIAYTFPRCHTPHGHMYAVLPGSLARLCNHRGGRRYLNRCRIHHTADDARDLGAWFGSSLAPS